MTRATVVFAEPCSPWITNTGYGPAGCRQKIRKPASNGQSESVTLTNRAGRPAARRAQGSGGIADRSDAGTRRAAGNDLPPLGGDLDRPPLLVAQIEVDRAVVVGEANVDALLRTIEQRLAVKDTESWTPCALAARSVSS